MKTHRTNRIRKCFRPSLASLEARTLLSQGNVVQTNLVSDIPGEAAVTDPNLVNPWGISESTTSPFWISDNQAGVSTLYSTPGQNGAPDRYHSSGGEHPDAWRSVRRRNSHRDRGQPRRGGLHHQRLLLDRGSDLGFAAFPVRHRGRHHRRLEPRSQSPGL